MSEPVDPDNGPRTYSGWKTTLAIIAFITAVAVAVNVLGERSAPHPGDRPPPVVTSVTPSG